MFKKFSLLLLVLVATPIQADIRIFACEPEWAELARALGGEQIYTATTNQQDPHHIQARPSLIAKARRADLLICTGAELEIGWLPLLLRKSGNPKIQAGQPGYFMATDYVILLDKPTQLDRSQGDVHSSGNPHVHLDPERMLQVAENLSKTLIQIDPSNQSTYQAKLESFSQEWQAMMQRLDKQIFTGKSMVVYHNSWLYLQQWLGLKQSATLEPKPGIPPTSSHLSRVLATLQQSPANMIVYAKYQDGKAAKWLTQKTNIPIVALDFSPATEESLIHWFERTVNQIAAILK
ncbi:zinc ABC transporter substrate-binding protein [Candidatus Halobeggiatoa sp. HSG11]|nr:zinc ABC transporter substrate-binding protein [Candidatus Halobeggiatoa sp. HSG11]